uniref:Trafficking protein particle complex 5 n=1 Tax=Piliocolobus tephrosceles TaxID=591936 RepID=A0A8C9I8H3_9PRIM
MLLSHSHPPPPLFWLSTGGGQESSRGSSVLERMTGQGRLPISPCAGRRRRHGGALHAREVGTAGARAGAAAHGGAVWKALFGKEADKLEQANDDARTFYIIEREPLINTYISVPKENSTLNCASFTAGIVEAVLTHSGFPAKVTAHWHKGTTLMIKFEEAVIARDRALEGR